MKTISVPLIEPVERDFKATWAAVGVNSGDIYALFPNQLEAEWYVRNYTKLRLEAREIVP